jgi:ribosomal protein S18 acetylase RimI-like enzyme
VLHVREATIIDVDAIAPLFDSYRQFYGKASDLGLARQFIAERLERRESIVFVAETYESGAVGFTQLYPSFSSARAARIYILNDLYVRADARRLGAGRQLLDAAAEFGRASGAVRLSLSTALTNTPAQKLYESMGWKRDDTFCEYGLVL